MRCSGWSSRSISACSAVALALVLAPSAAADLSVNPATVRVGQLVDLTFSVPNANNMYGVSHVTLGIPSAFQLADAEAKPGWTQSRTQQAISWSGGKIPTKQYATFAVRGTAPSKPETVLFNVLVGDRTGKSSTYHVALNVVTAPHSTGTRTIAKAALVVALVAALLGALACWLAWRSRRPGPDMGEV